MDNISIVLAAATMIGGAICLGVGGLLVTRGVIKPQIVEGHNEIAGFIFATVGVIYAVLLAFMVFAVWERFADADRAVTEEAAALVAAYRSTQTFPDPLRTQAQQAMRAYATTGVQAEWSNSGTEHFKPHTNPDPLNPIWDVYRELQPTTPSQTMLFTDAIQRLGDLEHQRHLRHLATESSLNEVFWIVLIVGAAITVGFCYFFHLENWRTHSLMTALLSGVIGAALFLIWSQNEPLIGPVHVGTGAFAHAVEQFRVIDLGHSAAAH